MSRYENPCGDNTRSSYWLRGSINDERLVLWTFQSQGRLYWAAVVEDISGALSIVATEDSSRASVFTVYSNETQLQLSIYYNGERYYVRGSDSQTGISAASLGINSDWISISTAEVDITQNVLSGVNYFGVYFGQSLGLRKLESNGVNNYVFSFRLIPTTVYPLGNCGEVVMDPNEVITLEENWALTNKVVPKFFTNSLDCYNGVFYNYCRVGRGCSINCKGNCDFGSTCLYDVKKAGWSCEKEKGDGVDHGSMFKRSNFWFTLAIIIVIMSAIAFAIGIYQYTSRTVTNVDSTSTVGQEVFLEPVEMTTITNIDA